MPHNRAATSTEAIEGHGHPSVAVAREVVNEEGHHRQYGDRDLYEDVVVPVDVIQGGQFDLMPGARGTRWLISSVLKRPIVFSAEGHWCPLRPFT